MLRDTGSGLHRWFVWSTTTAIGVAFLLWLSDVLVGLVVVVGILYATVHLISRSGTATGKDPSPDGRDTANGTLSRASGTRRCCTNRNWPARCQSTRSSPADAIRHWSAEGGHPIEDLTAEDGLTPLPSWTPGAKAIADDGLVSEERILHPALTMVP